jgi:penicillin-binding protein 1C
MDAFVLAEDKRFFSHHGVDLPALARGAFQSLTQFRKVSGGSTITMQLARTIWPELRGALHKPAQIIQAMRLEMNHSKGEILALYLNTVPFGNNISGVGAACRYFFDKSCDQLSSAQIAALAVLPRNPSLFIKNPASLVERRNALLSKMLSNADPLALKQAKAEPVRFAKMTTEFFAPHLTERILEENNGRIEIRTTLDLELQKSIQQLLSAETIKRRGTGDSGAVLVLDNDSGGVLAYVGSPDFFDPEHGMVDGVRVLRSPGSALKPFVYELAMENNWNLFSIVPDLPMVFSTKKAVYEPNNYGGNFSGPRTIREALGNSKNLPALYMTSQLGEANVLEHLRRFGFASLSQDSSYYGVGIALGNGEVSLWEITQAYATLARLGVAVPATYYQGEGGKPKRIVPEETTFLIADVLKDPEARHEEFGRFGPLEFDYEVGAKTGTSNDYRDNWTIGFTKKFTIGLWRGNADSAPMAQRLSASRGTGPLFHKIMDLLHRHRNPTWVARPATIEASRVCALSGQKPGRYCSVTRIEYHLKGNGPARECEMHKRVVVPNCGGREKEIVFVQFPKEYEEWEKTSRTPTLENQIREACGSFDARAFQTQSASTGPVIVEPLDRTVYAIDPTIPLSHQEIRFALRNVGKKNKAAVYVNDEPAGLVVDENELFWPVKRGQFKIYLKNGSLLSNAVNIQVR